MKRSRMFTATAIALAMIAGHAYGALGSHQKISRVLPSQPFGDGRDGALTISTSSTQSLVARSCSGSASSTSLTLTSAGFSDGDVVLIHQARGTGVGQWEINEVASGGGTTSLTLSEALQYTYTDSGASQAQVIQIPMYTDVEVVTGQTLTAAAWDGDTKGVLLFAASGTVTIDGTLNADGRDNTDLGGNGGGYRGNGDNTAGQSGRQSEGTAGAGGATTTAANGTGGGGGSYSNSVPGGGGGGGYGTGGSNGSSNGASVGSGGGTAGASDLSTMIFGGAGGGGGGTNSQAGNTGGNGAGIVWVIGKTVSIAGNITCIGGNGRNRTGGGGGGGAGGAVLIAGRNIALGSGNILATGGSGGTSSYGGTGGAGGNGRIAVHYGDSYTGSTTPAVTAIEDADFSNAPPNAFSLTSPPDQSATNNTKPTFTWSASSDPEGSPVDYTIEISTVAGFDPLYRSVSGLSATSYTPGVGEDIAEDDYYWRVFASDGDAVTQSTQTWQLAVDTSLPTEPVLTGYFVGVQSEEIEQLVGTSENGASITVYYWDGLQYTSAAGSTSWNGNTFTVDLTTSLASGSTLYIAAEDAASNVSESRTSIITYDEVKDVFQDTVTYHGTGPGSSMRLEQDTSYTFSFAVNSGTQVAVSAWLRKNSSYSGTQPSLTLSGLGISSTNSMSVGADAWEQVTVTGTPNAEGILKLTVDGYSTDTGAQIWIDDISVSQ